MYVDVVIMFVMAVYASWVSLYEYGHHLYDGCLCQVGGAYMYVDVVIIFVMAVYAGWLKLMWV